jgi:hypothetical protein
VGVVTEFLELWDLIAQVIATGSVIHSLLWLSSFVGMKTEQKYSELTVFVFYIMNRFLTWKIVSFNRFHNHFQPFFVLFNC